MSTLADRRKTTLTNVARERLESLPDGDVTLLHQIFATAGHWMCAQPEGNRAGLLQFCIDRDRLLDLALAALPYSSELVRACKLAENRREYAAIEAAVADGWDAISRLIRERRQERRV